MVTRERDRLEATDCAPLLQARVGLGESRIAGLEGGPCLAAVVESAEVAERVDNLRWTFEELDTETARDVEWDVAMHQPGTWVVTWESNDEVSASVHGVGIADDGVIEIVSNSLTATSTCTNDPEVVAVKMDWMWQGSVILDQPVGPCLRRDGQAVIICWEREGAVVDV